MSTVASCARTSSWSQGVEHESTFLLVRCHRCRSHDVGVDICMGTYIGLLLMNMVNYGGSMKKILAICLMGFAFSGAAHAADPYLGALPSTWVTLYADADKVVEVDTANAWRFSPGVAGIWKKSTYA